MNDSIINTIIFIATLIYCTKYINQGKKIIRLKSSKTVAKKYFFKSVLFELFCVVCAIITNNIMFLIVSALSLAGNIYVLILTIKYMHWKKYRKWDDIFDLIIRSRRT
jgi:lipid-A-disaccharide synthase-like uncharacterized protein